MPAAGRDAADGRVAARETPRAFRGVRFWRLRDEVVIGYGTESLTILSAIARHGPVQLRAIASAGLSDPQVKSFSGMQIYHMVAGGPRACSNVFCKFPAAGYH
jgi:hypothetical protein